MKATRRSVRWLMAILLSAMAVPALASSPPKEDSGPRSEYLEVKPSFVANFGGPGPVRYLKVDIALRLSKGDTVQARVEHHLPYIRHVMVMLLTKQTDETISSMEGKEKLRGEALGAVQKLLTEEEGGPLVDDLLFTNFIVQR